jgi:hypothetical protein
MHKECICIPCKRRKQAGTHAEIVIVDRYIGSLAGVLVCSALFNVYVIVG